MKKNYYNISNLLSTNAQYMMLLGQRANGKSYQVKLTALTNAYENKRNFIYLRRWKEDVKAKSVSSYFDDMPIKKITNNKWQEVFAYNGFIYFATRDAEGKIDKKIEIGRYCALNEYERYKSQVFTDYDYIIYEEFITDATYLNDEPRLLQQFVSTVARLNRLTVFLVGNTLSRVCPYFSEWCLEGVLKQKQGEIEIYHYHTESDKTVNIAVEYCANTNNENLMFFGQSAKQIISGEWDVKEVPKLPRKEYEYDNVYEMLIEYQAFKFVLELLVEGSNGGKICYVYPYTKKRKIYRRLTDEFSDLPNVSSRLDTSKKPEKFIYECMKLDKICYSDNLTGSDFRKVLENIKIV